MELSRTDPIPLYQQIKHNINEMIRDGRLLPGQRVPSEKELEKELGVSRITVRQALQELTLEEKVVRVPGKGTFVLHPKIEPLTALTSFSENMRAQGLIPSYRQAQVDLVEPPLKVRAVFQLDKEARVLHIHRLMLANDRPMAIQDEYLPEAIYHRNPHLFTPEILNVNSLYNTLERQLAIPLVRAEEYVDASVARSGEAELLCIKPGDLVLVITRITYTDDHSPIEYVKLIFRADSYRYRVELFRPR